MTKYFDLTEKDKESLDSYCYFLKDNGLVLRDDVLLEFTPNSLKIHNSEPKALRLFPFLAVRIINCPPHLGQTNLSNELSSFSTSFANFSYLLNKDFKLLFKFTSLPFLLLSISNISIN